MLTNGYIRKQMVKNRFLPFSGTIFVSSTGLAPPVD
jgi:hypothetical protein